VISPPPPPVAQVTGGRLHRPLHEGCLSSDLEDMTRPRRCRRAGEFDTKRSDARRRS